MILHPPRPSSSTFLRQRLVKLITTDEAALVHFFGKLHHEMSVYCELSARAMLQVGCLVKSGQLSHECSWLPHKGDLFDEHRCRIGVNYIGGHALCNTLSVCLNTRDDLSVNYHVAQS